MAPKPLAATSASGGPSCSTVEKPVLFGRQSGRGEARPAVRQGRDDRVKVAKMGGTRALGVGGTGFLDRNRRKAALAGFRGHAGLAGGNSDLRKRMKAHQGLAS